MLGFIRYGPTLMCPHDLGLIVIDGLSSFRRCVSGFQTFSHAQLLRSPLAFDSWPEGTRSTRQNFVLSDDGPYGMSDCSGSVAAVLAS
jgi:hypothetical protein